MLDFFKKKNKEEKKKEDEQLDNMPGMENMGMMQKMAMKRVMKMKPEKREELFKKALDPKNVRKNKKKILETLEQMEKSGQMNKHQVFEAKKRLGLLGHE